MVQALIKEISLQKDYLKDRELRSIYFGGGTPSLLNEKELKDIFEAIHQYYTVVEDAEITLEANPDDLTKDYLQMLRHTPVNRLSIGVQSFWDEDLLFMNRAHQAAEAISCIRAAQDTGFSNLTIDLIYALPALSNERWQQNLETFSRLDIPHLSAYCLTVEEGTALHYFVKKAKAPPVDEQRAAQQFEMLMDFAERQQYIHYEISNFAAKSSHIAVHNTAYWKGSHYLGIGPSAHSYDGISRHWNIANNALYIKAIEERHLPLEREVLSHTDQYNEYLLTRLRTCWGIETNELKRIAPRYASSFAEKIQGFEHKGWVEKTNGGWVLSRKGKMLADKISAELMEL